MTEVKWQDYLPTGHHYIVGIRMDIAPDGDSNFVMKTLNVSQAEKRWYDSLDRNHDPYHLFGNSAKKKGRKK